MKLLKNIPITYEYKNMYAIIRYNKVLILYKHLGGYYRSQWIKDFRDFRLYSQQVRCFEFVDTIYYRSTDSKYVVYELGGEDEVRSLFTLKELLD